MKSLALLLLTVVVASAAEPRPIVLRDLPLLFADDSGLSSKSGVVRFIHPARQRNEPVLQPERRWESDRVYIYGSVYRDAASGLFRMWYLSRLLPGDAKVPGFRSGKFDVDAYATSQDGLHWDRPNLGLHPYQGSTDNNILFDLHSPSVLLDEHEQDPARRYKMLGSYRGAYYAAVSPDGLRWSKFPNDQPILTNADNISLAQDPVTGEYLAYHRRPAKSGGGRAVWLARSSDFVTWSNRFSPSKQTPRTTSAS